MGKWEYFNMNIIEKSYTKIVMDFIERNGVNHGK